MGLVSRVVERWRGRSGAVPLRRYRGGPLLDYARTPNAHWQRDLDAATQTGDGNSVARLYVHWVPGDPWQPVHRWFLFQLQPWAHVPPHTKAELRGPHPRTGAELHYRPRVIDGKLELRPGIRGGPCRSIDRTQWCLHRELERTEGVHVFPRYAWVIQGDAGGHPFQASSEEQLLRKAQGVGDVPSAGDLPYAPFDGRVIAALRNYDMWRAAHGLSDPTRDPALVAVARATDLERTANRAVWAMREAVGEEVADGMAFAARQDGLHYHRWRPVGQKARDVDWSQLREQYIDDTSFSD